MTLEEKAEEYAEKHAFRVPYDNSNKFYDDVDFKASKEGYLAGAKENEEQLKQAKKIIKKCMEVIEIADFEYVKEYKQAEQFLREIDITNAIQKANEGFILDKIADEVEQDIKEQNEVTIASVWEKRDEVPLKLKVSEVYNEGCPDILCENCSKEDCTVRKLGLVPTKQDIKEQNNS